MTLLDRIVPSVQRAKAETGSHLLVSVALAQIIHESNYGKSELAVNANNYAGHKYDPKLHDDDYPKYSPEWDGNKMVRVKSVFAKYANFDEFIKQHFNWFTSNKRREKVYADLFKANTAEEQAKAFTGTYATDPQYANHLMKYINKYNLTKYDTKGVDTTVTFPKPKIIDRRTRALGYPGRGVYPNRSLSSITMLVWHYSATVRSGSAEEVIKGHERYWRNHHGWDIGGYHYFIGRDGTILQNYDLTLGTYGAGKANPYTIHICCEASNKNNYTQAQIKSREELTLWLMSRSDLPNLKGLRGHKEVPGNDTPCPGYSETELDAYRKDIYGKLKAGSNASKYNPKGMDTVKINNYTSPNLPFDKLNVGDTVTIRKPHTFWYDPQTKHGIKPSKDFSGTKDKIKEVMDIDGVSYSKRAYLLEKYNSWILEQDLVEARDSWVTVEDKPEVEVEDKHNHSRDYTHVELREGQFYLEGELYEVSKVN